MSEESPHYDLLVIGSGPAGQKAAIQAAKIGASVALAERRSAVGGHSVSVGTLPSKTLREATLTHAMYHARAGGAASVDLPQPARMDMLLRGLSAVVEAHRRYVAEQLDRNRITVLHGRARFEEEKALALDLPSGHVRRVVADRIIVATGARPDHPPSVPVDHEHVLDSDSVFTLPYLPRTLAVIGAGVSGCEFASIFSALGLEVTLIDERERPVDFFDPDLTDGFEQALSRRGARYIPHARAVSAHFNGLEVELELDSGEVVRAEKVLSAIGRRPNLDGLDLEKAGLEVSSQGRVEVDGSSRTARPHIYVVGDASGPPYQVSCAMEQGRRAALHALGFAIPAGFGPAPIGIYAVPEMAMVGLTEAEARARYGAVTVGIARYAEVARGHVAGLTEGLLKLVADERGERVYGVHILGESATELIHVGQMALIGEVSVDAFVEHVFNFPTFAEAYRVAALDIVGQRFSARSGRPSDPCQTGLSEYGLNTASRDLLSHPG